MRLILVLTAAAGTLLLANPAAAELASCKITFSLSGWSFVVKTMKGSGKVTCSNGQSADVDLKSTGAGLTIGKSDILAGKGTFSEVKSIDEIFGTYVQAQASGSATKGGQAQAMTKGEISLAIAGEGRGWDAGVTLGGFTISRK